MINYRTQIFTHPRSIHAVLQLLLVVALLLASIPPVHAQSQDSNGPTGDESTPGQATPQVTPTADPTLAAEQALEAQIDALLASMTVADRVGQLFLISFEGNDISFDSDIAELIYGYRVGGVLLSPENGNFSNEKGVDTPRQVASLINRLQALAYGLLLPEERALQPIPDEPWPPPGMISMEQMTGAPPLNIPLFVAVEQAGDDLPSTALRRGFTPLPSAMALGATWNQTLARQVGEIVGRELRAVGVNLLLGPNLDVIEAPRADRVGSLGLQSFGGDPYWVSQIGRAYITGVHQGGQGRVATIARHFPGAGSADRLPDDEVAIVQKSQQELEQMALPPFQTVTRRASSILRLAGDPGATDGLMSSHMRYTGFQGNTPGRSTPISLTPDLTQVLEMEGMGTWRGQGGLLVSNALGIPAIRRYYSPNLDEFPYRRIAMEAFSAGHDILLLDRFSLDDRWENEKANIKETIAFFQERYINDPDFAAQVDAAVRRILRLKLRLYTAPVPTTAPTLLPIPPITATLALNNVLVQADDLSVLGGEQRANALAVVGQVAREAVTLLYPDPANAADLAPPMIQPGDHLLIFTDSRLVQECPGCVAETAINPDELAQIMLRLYGPGGTGQIQEEQVTSLTFSDLAQLLDTEEAAAAHPPAKDPSSTSTPSTSTPPAEASPAAGAPPPAEGEVAGTTGEQASTTDEELLDKNEKTRLQIQQATWLIFAMLDVVPEQYPNSNIVKRFLRLHGEQLANKQVVVLSFHAPYFLDTTEIGKLNVYYGLYSKTQPFLEAAVRALFRSFTPGGAPPVGVPGTRFSNLADRLRPDPNRPIDLHLLVDETEIASLQTIDTDEPPPTVDVGTMLRIQVGPVYDLNGKVVPDGTRVNFQLIYEGEELALPIEPAMTRNGIAIRDVLLERSGMLRVAAQAGQATTGQAITLNVQGTALAETGNGSAAENASAASAAADMTSTTAMTGPAQVAALVENTPGGAENLPENRIPSLIIALLTIAATLSLLLIVEVRVLPRAILVHSMLWAVIFGLAAYILYGLGWLPGSQWLQSSLRIWGAGVVVFIAMLFPLVWLQLRMEP
ncbi:glycoside hydrolase family 3 protein [Litorilinea aerophila]|uniref:beta-N-acetylhexosaminidase n=1 Tax=Litorilinea aerophila TaxID=1204385 RepID=A0A540VF96_9CHLR|nr:glycoside hydrolase family 3 N-terminal domain-containing protein [Litorilinea aerophila]MCC9076961.1 glycoside hydrolase family 3 protein [Litorilinea aerophila]